MYAYYDGETSGMEVFASKNKDTNLIEKVKAIEVNDNYELQGVFNSLGNGLSKYEDTGIWLYDDAADVEIRSIRALDDIVGSELKEYKQVLKEEGFRGLFEYFF